MSAPRGGNRLPVTWALPVTCHCLPAPRPGDLASKGNEWMQRVRLDTQASSRNQLLQLCLPQPRPAQHTETKEQLSGSCSSTSTPPQGSNGTAQLPLPLQRLFPLRGMWECGAQNSQDRGEICFPSLKYSNINFLPCGSKTKEMKPKLCSWQG